jgi:DNA polymerase-3 subunit alpha
MSSKGFTHLHLHSQYSLLDGAVTFEGLFARCKKLGMNAVAVTDHGNMFGAVEFYTKAKAAEIKPILGIEAYIAPGSRFDRTKTSISDAAYHLILLAENHTGYQNLLKLASTGYVDGFYYRPRIDKEILAECHEGLICATACLKGEVTAAAAAGDMKAARQAAESYLKIFGPQRFFIEIQRHQSDGPDPTAALIDLANELGIGLIATNDVHFLSEDDHEAHNCLCAISTGKHADDPDRMIYPPDVYLKSDAEMRKLFPEAQQACDNTIAIAERCHVELDLSTRHAPRFRPPDGSTPEDYLARLCLEGIKDRYGEMTPQIKERLDRELQVIQSKGFSSYFLIVWDFCNHARKHNIPLGARGSGVGTLVGYCLGLCSVDPLRYDLLFERFMDPARNEMPDIDIDMCQVHRQEIIEYVRQKYGQVAQIITFGTMKAKAVIRDICRVLGVPLAEADRLAKLVPFSLDMTLDKALETEPELKKAYDENELTRRVIDVGRKLEGLARHASVHAAGVVIADEPLTNFVPLYKAPGTEDIITQYEGPMVEKVGLLKMDFLGLKTLSVLERARQLIQQKHGVDLDLEKLDITDPKTFKIFADGKTKGVFQFESGGMQDLLMKMKPDRIEDLIAANALYRPGPMILIPDYIDRKHGARWSLPHPIMTEVLQETYGIMCIHEDTRIAMADGTEKPIRDVRIGDNVQSLNRATSRFEVKQCHGCGPTRRANGVKITLENGFSVTLTDDHQVYTFDGMKEAGRLDPACDLVAVGRHLPQAHVTARHLAPWLGADEDVAYLLGSLIGDGAMTGKGISLATGREEDHRKLLAWMHERLPSLHAHEYFHGRSWYLSLSHPQLLNDPSHGNRKTRLHQLIESLGMKVSAQHKHVPEVIFRCSPKVRAAFLAGLLDADGCTAVGTRKGAVCFLSSCSLALLEDVRHLCELEGIPTTIRTNRIQFWDLQTLARITEPFLLVRRFAGRLTRGQSVGWIPRSRLLEAVPTSESLRAFSRRTGIMRAGMKHDFPFVKSVTALKAGIDLGGLRYYRIAKIERVQDQQFYGMSVADHHNLVANGIVVKNCYQEQVMRICNRMGDIPLRDAYTLIKAISKKKASIIVKEKERFLTGCVGKGLKKEEAEQIFELIERFAGYGFNKSHSTRYAFIAYQTAYLKAHWPVEFMAALLTYEMGDTDKIVEYIAECQSMGVEVMAPDINDSDVDFTPLYKETGQGDKGVIRFGLAAVKGVGEKAVEQMIAARRRIGRFQSLFHFCENVDLRAVNKQVIEALIKGGAFDRLGGNRHQMMVALERAMEVGASLQLDKINGQMNFFGQMTKETDYAEDHKQLPDVPPWPELQMLAFEKQVLGFYVTSNPLSQHAEAINDYSTTNSARLAQSSGTSDGQSNGHTNGNGNGEKLVTIGGMITKIRYNLTKTGRNAGSKMAVFTLEDLQGQIEVVLFPDALAELAPLLVEDTVVFVRGKADYRRERPNIIASEMIPIDKAREKLAKGVRIRLDARDVTKEKVMQIRSICQSHKGSRPLSVVIMTDKGKVYAAADRSLSINPDVEFCRKMRQVVGDENFSLAK